MGADARIAELKLDLPPVPKPAGVYKPVLAVGGLAYGPFWPRCGATSARSIASTASSNC